MSSGKLQGKLPRGIPLVGLFVDEQPDVVRSTVETCGLAYAQLCGATGIKVDALEQLDAAMARLLAADGPALLHIEQDPELL